MENHTVHDDDGPNSDDDASLGSNTPRVSSQNEGKEGRNEMLVPNCTFVSRVRRTSDRDGKIQ